MNSNDENVIVRAIDEIFAESTPPEHVVSIIEYYSKKFSEGIERFYVVLQFQYYSVKGSINAIESYPEKKTITTEIDGTILYINENSSGWETLYVIGDPQFDYDSAIAALNEKVKSVNIEKRHKVIQDYNKSLYESSKTNIIVRNNYSNPTLLPQVSINVNVGDVIKKGTNIGVIDFYAFTHSALLAMRKKEIIVAYVSEKLNKKSGLKIKQNGNWFEKMDINMSNKKDLNLYDIWRGSDLQYHELIINLLSNDGLTYDSFIWADGLSKIQLPKNRLDTLYKLDSPNTINGNIIYWRKEPQRGWQRYLAGLLFVLNSYDFINKDEFSAYDLVAICKNTFSIEKLDNGVFNDMKADFLSQKYIDPFRGIVKKIL